MRNTPSATAPAPTRHDHDLAARAPRRVRSASTTSASSHNIVRANHTRPNGASNSGISTDQSSAADGGRPATQAALKARLATVPAKPQSQPNAINRLARAVSAPSGHNNAMNAMPPTKSVVPT